MLDAKNQRIWKEKIPSARGALQRASNARPPGKLGTKTGLQLTGWPQAGPQMTVRLSRQEHPQCARHPIRFKVYTDSGLLLSVSLDSIKIRAFTPSLTVSY